MEVNITRVFQDGIELNWLPPTEPNGEVHYVIYYTPEGGTEQSIDTGSNLTHYNLTGLERNRVYTNIAVQAVNSVGRSDRSAAIAQYNHTLPSELCTKNTMQLTFHSMNSDSLTCCTYKNTTEPLSPCLDPWYTLTSYIGMGALFGTSRNYHVAITQKQCNYAHTSCCIKCLHMQLLSNATHN